MTRSKWTKLVCTILLWMIPGSTLLATSCGASLRDSLIGAGSDFVGASFGTILDALFPVKDWVAPSDAA